MKLRAGVDHIPGVVLFENEQFYDRLTPKQARTLALVLLHRADVEDDRKMNFDRPPNYYADGGDAPSST